MSSAMVMTIWLLVLIVSLLYWLGRYLITS
jgi:hypothetical protein